MYGHALKHLVMVPVDPVCPDRRGSFTKQDLFFDRETRNFG
jgi:hypothetical protein